MNIENTRALKSNLFGSRSIRIVLVEIILVILITYYFANIFLKLISGQNDIEQKTGLPMIDNISKTISYSFIPVELFGKELKKTAAPLAKKVVQLNLKLNGTIQNKDKSVALISKSGSKAKVYAIGEKIMAGVTVSEIHNDSVVLLHNGQNKILKMEKATGGQSIFKMKQSSNKSTNKSTNKSMRNKVSTYKKQLVKNPQKLANLFVGEPVIQDNKYKGIKVSSAKNKELLEHLGLKDGDIVMSVDNIPLNDFSKLGELASKMSLASKAEVLLLRDGVEQRITLDLGN